MPIVIDANIAIAWFRPSPSALADAVLDELCEHGAVVPALWRWEVQDVLRRLHEGGLLTMSFETALMEMSQLPITVDDRFLGLFGDESELSKKHGLSVYDAAYLELAIRHRVRLATIDKKLSAAAKTVGAAFLA
jgi:predicted nucleic acid-binding protein